MVNVDFDELFQKKILKIKNNAFKEKVKKQIRKIIHNPKVGKPMKNVRKRTREVYIPPFRLSYTYFEKENKIIFFDLYHKDKQ